MIEPENDLRDFLISQASEAVFLFNKVHSGLEGSLSSEERRLKVAIALTSAILRNISSLENQLYEEDD
jgi:hypothetical protein